MKINEIINEGIWDTIKAGAAGIKGAVQGGIAGAKSAYQAQQTAQPAAQGSVVQQAPGFKEGPIQPRTGAAQYAKDIASAISTGASGSYYTQGATATPYGRAPKGTKIGQWSKTDDGWVNTTNNKAATSLEAETLNRTWYSKTQKQLRQQGARPQTAQTTQQPATKTVQTIQPTAQNISAPTNPGAPTSAEQAKLQRKIQAAMAAQQQP